MSRLCATRWLGAVRRPRVGAGRLVVAVTLVVVGVPVSLGAQTVGAGVSLQNYEFGDPQVAGIESFHLFTVPWGAHVPIAGGVSLAASGAHAKGAARGPLGAEASLSGMTDTDLTLGYQHHDWLVVNLDATLATGRNTLSTEESFVAGVIAADLLPFSMNTWGSGRSLGTTVAVATQAGAWGIGFAGAYRAASSFEPISDLDVRYNPGNQIRARVAFDRDIGLSNTLSFILGYQHFTDDDLQGTNLFKAGSRLQGTLSLAFPLGLRSSASVYAGLNHRSQGTLLLDESQLAGAGDSPSQQLILAGADLRVPFGPRMSVLPRGELRVFRASDGASQGWVSSIGTSLDLRLTGNSASRRLVLSPSGMVRLGKVIVRQGDETGIFGWEAGLTLRVEGGR